MNVFWIVKGEFGIRKRKNGIAQVGLALFQITEKGLNLHDTLYKVYLPVLQERDSKR